MAGTRVGEATWTARTIRVDLGREIREARLSSGLSLRAAAKAVGMSHNQFSRIERAELPTVSVEQLSLACSAVGLRFAGRAWPHGEPIRDRAQLALIKRFRARLAHLRVHLEVPLPTDRDRRAWDLVVDVDPHPTAIEAESRVRDVQALLRRIALKQRDGGMTSVVLLLNDTASNRRALELHRAELITSFPLAGVEVLAALDRGRAPSANGLLLL